MSEPAEVSVDVEAPALRVYELVSDLPRMGEWSPECVRCAWRGGADSALPGARFKGFNRRGWRRWSTNGQVVTAEPARELSFDISSLGLPVARWTYMIDDTGPSSSRVTERWEDRRGRLITFLGKVGTGIDDRREHNLEGMRTTLERIKAEAEGAEGAAAG